MTDNEGEVIGGSDAHIDTHVDGALDGRGRPLRHAGARDDASRLLRAARVAGTFGSVSVVAVPPAGAHAADFRDVTDFGVCSAYRG